MGKEKERDSSKANKASPRDSQNRKEQSPHVRTSYLRFQTIFFIYASLIYVCF